MENVEHSKPKSFSDATIKEKSPVGASDPNPSTTSPAPEPSKPSKPSTPEPKQATPAPEPSKPSKPSTPEPKQAEKKVGAAPAKPVPPPVDKEAEFVKRIWKDFNELKEESKQFVVLLYGANAIRIGKKLKAQHEKNHLIENAQNMNKLLLARILRSLKAQKHNCIILCSDSECFHGEDADYSYICADCECC